MRNKRIGLLQFLHKCDTGSNRNGDFYLNSIYVRYCLLDLFFSGPRVHLLGYMIIVSYVIKDAASKQSSVRSKYDHTVVYLKANCKPR
jgi:hypothetical protein